MSCAFFRAQQRIDLPCDVASRGSQRAMEKKTTKVIPKSKSSQASADCYRILGWTTDNGSRLRFFNFSRLSFERFEMQLRNKTKNFTSSSSKTPEGASELSCLTILTIFLRTIGIDEWPIRSHSFSHLRIQMADISCSSQLRIIRQKKWGSEEFTHLKMYPEKNSCPLLCDQ